MDNWLEEIEERQKKKLTLSEKAKKRIQAKKEKVVINYTKNKDAYLNFINKLNQLVNRVNTLPEEERNEFIVINSKFKKTEFDNQLHIYSTSKRIYIYKKKFIFWGKKKYKFKYIRVIYFSISKEIDKVEIEIKEKYLAKGHRKKHTADDVHRLYKLPFSTLENEDLSYQIINWLAFKYDVSKLPFFS